MEITSFGKIRQAGCHCDEHSLDFLCENLIHHVDKVDNPANLPEVRPLEDFQSILKVKVYESNWEAKTLHQLEVRIKKCLNEVDQVTILKTNGCVKKILKYVRMLGIFENRKYTILITKKFSF